MSNKFPCDCKCDCANLVDPEFLFCQNCLNYMRRHDHRHGKK